MVLTDDRDTLVLDDILVGDVYLAAGQSNMELEMRESKEKKLPSYRSNVRIMTVPKYIYPFEDDNQRWKELNEETVSSFSAVASFLVIILMKIYQSVLFLIIKVVQVLHVGLKKKFLKVIMYLKRMYMILII